MSLEQKNDDKWINVEPRTKKLSLRFRVRGFSRQFYLSTGLTDNKRNREILRSRRDAIMTDIALERFDPTLGSYKFKAVGKTPAVAIAPTPGKYQYNLAELWDKFTNFQATQLEQSTISGNYRTITNITKQLPSQKLDEALLIRDWLLERFSPFTAWQALSAYERCCRWTKESGLIPNNPFEKINITKPKKRSNEDVCKAYTLEQRDLIIEAFESHPKFSHYSSLIKFLFWTGCRPGEAFALTWGDISPDCCRISINKAYASQVRVLKGTKNNKRRVFPCSQDSRLRSLLLAIKPNSPNPKNLIFKSRLGQQTNLKILEKCWRGHSIPGYQYDGVVRELANQSIVPYLKVYSTRHTFATWAIATGSSPEKVAYWLGDNIQTVLAYYCHPDVTKAECPDF